uniref:Uncharacterized protein n=1 Tax=Utricularia reniformis TaxID=192314 RepID=A0A1Y0B4K4_9LAMI|nr:hypothetical protein AEK19_MT2166 [Utricularia reniformis]ART32314.1 hypothetical protein AEK19_MT2166 [Utricularia reniformis]
MKKSKDKIKRIQREIEDQIKKDSEEQVSTPLQEDWLLFLFPLVFARISSFFG